MSSYLRLTVGADLLPPSVQESWSVLVQYLPPDLFPQRVAPICPTWTTTTDQQTGLLAGSDRLVLGMHCRASHQLRNVVIHVLEEPLLGAVARSWTLWGTGRKSPWRSSPWAQSLCRRRTRQLTPSPWLGSTGGYYYSTSWKLKGSKNCLRLMWNERKMKGMKRSRKSDETLTSCMDEMRQTLRHLEPCDVCMEWVWRPNRRRLTTPRACSRATQVCHVIVGFHVLRVDLGFHVVIGVGRLTIHFHHAPAILRTKIFSGCGSPTLSCHRQFKLNPKFLHISHRENGSFEVLSLHSSEGSCGCLVAATQHLTKWVQTLTICDWKIEFSIVFSKYCFLDIESFRVDFWCEHRFQLLSVSANSMPPFQIPSAYNAYPRNNPSKTFFPNWWILDWSFAMIGWCFSYAPFVWSFPIKQEKSFANKYRIPSNLPPIFHPDLIATILQTYLLSLCVLLSQKSHLFEICVVSTCSGRELVVLGTQLLSGSAHGCCLLTSRKVKNSRNCRKPKMMKRRKMKQMETST